MPAPSKLAAARAAEDRHDRIHAMAETMARYESSEGACTFGHLTAAGFSEAEIRTYQDEARAIAQGRSPTLTLPEGRLEGLALVAEARAVRSRHLALAEA